MISDAFVNNDECIIRFSSEVPAVLANSIRRTILLDLDERAISNITVHTNTSVYPCELIAHRMGMIPIITDCKEVVIDATGPMTVYSDMITCKHTKKQVTPHGIMLFPIAEGQRVNFTCKITTGNGRKHARFSHCAGVSMKKCSTDNTNMEKECWCGANFTPKLNDPSLCARCNYKQYSSNPDDAEYVLSYKTINSNVNPVSYTLRAIDAIAKKLKAVKEVSYSQREDL